MTRTLAVDWLNRSMLTDFLPVQSLRGVGLYALDRIGPLRRLVMREGIAPSSSEPALMRGEVWHPRDQTPPGVGCVPGLSQAL
jgi:2-octaprenyl-6-methoxyphenol hydroxylase